MKLPTIAECQELFQKYKVPGTVRIHCHTVHTVAVFLAEELTRKGYPLRLEIVKPFSLLHDFMKAVVLERLGSPPYDYTPTKEELAMHQQLRKQYPGKSETQVAYRILKEKYPEFAALFLELDELTRHPHASVHEETRFIHYVDWRVLGNKIVPLRQRMDYIYGRYGKWIQKNNIDWNASKQEQFDYEQKIFKHSDFQPDELAENMNHG
jgi:hypothetical protein